MVALWNGRRSRFVTGSNGLSGFRRGTLSPDRAGTGDILDLAKTFEFGLGPSLLGSILGHASLLHARLAARIISSTKN